MATAARSNKAPSVDGIVEAAQRRRGLSRDDLEELIKLTRASEGRITDAFPLGIPAPDGSWGVPSYWGRVHVHWPHTGVDISSLIDYAIDRGHIVKVFPNGVPAVDGVVAVIEAGGFMEQG